MHKHLLAAIDGSNMSHLVVEKAVEEALLKNATLTIMRVLETPQYLLDNAKVLRMMQRTKLFLEEELRDLKKEIAQKFPEDKITVLVEEGSPKQKILEVVEQQQSQVDLVVVGATGESEETMTGSTANYVINLAPCDVLVVRS